jgi:hypothetical protein
MKKTVKRKKAVKKVEVPVKKNGRYTCLECGFSVIVENSCDCEDPHELFCCDTPMICG